MSDFAVGFSGLVTLATEYKADSTTELVAEPANTVSLELSSESDSTSLPIVSEESATTTLSQPAEDQAQISSSPEQSTPEETVPPPLSISSQPVQAENCSTPETAVVTNSPPHVVPDPSHDQGEGSNSRHESTAQPSAHQHFRPDPQGIGGFLSLFCFVAIVGSPVAFLASSYNLFYLFKAYSPELYKTFPSLSDFFTHYQIALSMHGILAVITGYVIYSGSKLGRSAAFSYLVSGLLLILLPFLLLPTAIPYKVHSAISGSFINVSKGFLPWVVFWFLYFLLSKRVRNNYSGKYSVPIRGKNKGASRRILFFLWGIVVLLAQVPAVLNVDSFQLVDIFPEWQFKVENVTAILRSYSEQTEQRLSAERNKLPANSVNNEPEDKPSQNDQPQAPQSLTTSIDEIEDNNPLPSPLSQQMHSISIGTTVFNIPAPPGTQLRTVTNRNDKGGYQVHLGFIQEDKAQGYLAAYAFTTIDGTEERMVDDQEFEIYRSRLLRLFEKSPVPPRIMENAARTITISTLSDIEFNQQGAKQLTTESFSMLNKKLYRLLVNIVFPPGIEPPDGFESILSWRIAILKANHQVAGASKADSLFSSSCVDLSMDHAMQVQPPATYTLLKYH